MRRLTLGPIASSKADVDHFNGSANASKMTERRMRQSIGNPSKRYSMVSNTRRMSSKPKLSTSSRNSRRSSTFGSRNIRSDPRPIADKTYMHASINALIQFLSERNYDHPLSVKLLSRPMKKDFESIVIYMLQCIDTRFEMVAKFEDEMTLVFRHFKYPFAISKTALVAVGSPHSWPGLLACVTWLMELILYQEEVEREEEEMENNSANDMFFHYLGKAYRSFMSGDDAYYDSLEQGLATDMTTKNNEIQEQVEAMNQENESLRQQIQQERNTMSTIPALIKRQEDLRGDLDKFKAHLVEMQTYTNNVNRKLKQAENEILEKDNAILDANREISKTKRKIEVQEFSVHEVEQMVLEKERIERKLQEVNDKRQIAQTTLANIKTTMSKEAEELSQIVFNYNELATSLKLIPENAKYANGKDFEIQIDHQASDENISIVFTQDIKGTIRPALDAFKRNRCERMNAALDEALVMETKIQDSQSKLEHGLQQQHNMELAVSNADEQLARDKEVLANELYKNKEQCEQLELAIAHQKQLEETGDYLGLESHRGQVRAAKERLKENNQRYAKEKQQICDELGAAFQKHTDHKRKMDSMIESYANYVASRNSKTLSNKENVHDPVP